MCSLVHARCSRYSHQYFFPSILLIFQNWNAHLSVRSHDRRSSVVRSATNLFLLYSVQKYHINLICFRFTSWFPVAVVRFFFPLFIAIHIIFIVCSFPYELNVFFFFILFYGGQIMVKNMLLYHSSACFVF